MKKLHLILLSLVSAVPGGYLCYLLGTALALPRSDLWKKPLLGSAVVGTGLLVLLAAVVWPLLYAVAFYDDPNKNKPAVDGEGGEDEADAGELEEDTPKTPRSDSFEDEDVDVFEREGVTAESSDDEDFEPAEEGDEFGVEEESIESAETADFDLGDDEFADLEMDEEVEEVEEEEEEAPKKKAKKKKK